MIAQSAHSQNWRTHATAKPAAKPIRGSFGVAMLSEDRTNPVAAAMPLIER